MAKIRPVVLTILDGWGFSPAVEGNAITAARKPVYDHLLREYPNTLVHTSGPYVGLPEGQMGNSEVGHLNIGAGRVVYQDLTRISKSIKVTRDRKASNRVNLVSVWDRKEPEPWLLHGFIHIG